MNKVIVGEKDLRICEGVNGCKVAIDTGTSLNTAPSLGYQQIDREIGHLIKEDCSNTAELPTIKFGMDDKLYELAPQVYPYPSVLTCSLLSPYQLL